MNFFYKILILLRWIKIDTQRMKHWYLMDNKAIVLFILKKGLFQERLLAIKTLKQFKDETTIPHLLKVAQKDYKEIAMKALHLASTLDKKKIYTSKIESIKQEWKIKQEKINNRIVSSVKKERANKHTRMKALERVRQQLKKPMR